MGAPTKYKPSLRAVAQYCPRFVLARPRHQMKKTLPSTVPARLFSPLHEFQLSTRISSRQNRPLRSPRPITTPQSLKRLFSIAYTLFLIHNVVHPLYFLTAAHSLPKTPGGGGSQLSKNSPKSRASSSIRRSYETFHHAIPAVSTRHLHYRDPSQIRARTPPALL
jgi:hypothetical protein